MFLRVKNGFYAKIKPCHSTIKIYHIIYLFNTYCLSPVLKVLDSGRGLLKLIRYDHYPQSLYTNDFGVLFITINVIVF